MTRKRWLPRWCAFGVVALALAACNGDPEVVPDADEVPPPEEAPAPEAGPITFEDLATRCDELTDIVEELRGPPAQVEADIPPEPSTVTGQIDYETNNCRYLYEGDDFNDPNRVSLEIQRQPGGAELTPEVREVIFDQLAFDDEIDGLGDEARYVRTTTFGALGMVYALSGDAVYMVRVTVPEELADEPFMQRDPLVEAAREFMTRLGA